MVEDERERDIRIKCGKYRNWLRMSEMCIVVKNLRKGGMNEREEGYNPSGD